VEGAKAPAQRVTTVSAPGTKDRSEVASLLRLADSLRSLRASLGRTGCAGSEGAEAGPPRASNGLLRAVGDALGGLACAGRSVASSGPRTGITRATGPGWATDSDGARRQRSPLLLWPRRSGSAFTRGSVARDALCSRYTRGPAGGGLFNEVRCCSNRRKAGVALDMRGSAYASPVVTRQSQPSNARQKMPGIRFSWACRFPCLNRPNAHSSMRTRRTSATPVREHLPPIRGRFAVVAEAG
jgi:hypothetical protein